MTKKKAMRRIIHNFHFIFHTACFLIFQNNDQTLTLNTVLKILPILRNIIGGIISSPMTLLTYVTLENYGIRRFLEYRL